MAKPALVVVNGDLDTLVVLEQALKRRFGADYQVLAAESAVSATTRSSASPRPWVKAPSPSSSSTNTSARRCQSAADIRLGMAPFATNVNRLNTLHWRGQKGECHPPRPAGWELSAWSWTSGAAARMTTRVASTMREKPSTSACVRLTIAPRS
jgi:hypothetical protein